MHSAYSYCLPSPRHGCAGAALPLITAACLHSSFLPLPSLPCLPKPLHCLHTLPHLSSSGLSLCSAKTPSTKIKKNQIMAFHNSPSTLTIIQTSYTAENDTHLPFYPIPEQCPHCLQGSGHRPCPLLLDPLFSMGASTPTTRLVHGLASFCRSGLRSSANFWNWPLGVTSHTTIPITTISCPLYDL